MSEQIKPREFLIYPEDEIGHQVRVIERSAFDAQALEIEKLKAKLRDTQADAKYFADLCARFIEATLKLQERTKDLDLERPKTFC